MTNDANRPGVSGQDTSTSIDSDAANPAGERDLITEVEETIASVHDAMPRVERAAHYREMMSSLRRAASTAKLLLEAPGEEVPEVDSSEEEEGPATEPHRPSGRSLALLSDGHVALNVTYLEGADLTGYQRWEGIILTPEQAEEALEGLSDAADDVAANIGGLIRWRKDEPEDGGGSNE
jgi:hypothetical protein